MTDVRSSSSSALSRSEISVCEYWADAETMRIQPRNPAAYRAVVLARKQAEMLDQKLQRALTGAFTVSATRKLAETAPLEPEYFSDTETAVSAMRSGIEQGRRERAELLARLESEQSRDIAWK